jgi:2-polyprenyl-3-methyl-5-hydroxy-6-metoxy-1,4-benzoquinol methylase
MRTAPSLGNPYRYNRYSFAWENVPPSSPAHLDFGCGDGRFLASLKTKGIDRLVGVDISRDVVCRARQRFPELEILHISDTVPLPLGDAQFMSITLMDVIEHIDEQNALLDELNHVLKHDGVLIVTVPNTTTL